MPIYDIPEATAMLKMEHARTEIAIGVEKYAGNKEFYPFFEEEEVSVPLASEA